MSEQKIQHRLGKYQIMGLLSYGSTSNVFKIKQIAQQNTQPTLVQNQSNFELVTIDMSYHHQTIIDETQQISSENNKDWILKLYNLERMVNKENEFLDDVKYDILVEIIFLTYLHHPGIVKAKQMLLEYQKVVDPNNPSNIKKKLIKAGIVMQICEKGCFNSLVNYINRTKALKENKVNIMKFYLSQVANTLMYLNQQCKILHRDLKAQNIMVNKQLDIKVIDYGVSKININYLSKLFGHPQKQTIFNLFGFGKNLTLKQLYSKIQNNQGKRKNLIGSKHYISPELIEKYRSDMELIDQGYEKTDIWSFGVFMYRVFHDRYPFQGRNLRQTLDMIANQDRQPLISEDLPQQVTQVIRKCLKKDYQQRASWKQIMSMSYFSSISLNEIFSVVSPIVDLISKNKKEKQMMLSNADKILFDEKLVLKYEKQGNKKRRVLLIKQKQQSYPKMLVLKEKQSISSQIALSDRNCLKISRQDNYLRLHYQDASFNETIQICQQTSKQIVDRLVQKIFEAFELRQNNIEKEKSTGQCE